MLSFCAILPLMTYAKTANTAVPYLPSDLRNGKIQCSKELSSQEITYVKRNCYKNNNIDYLPVFYVNPNDIFMPSDSKVVESDTTANINMKKVIPGGMTVGIRINTNGVMVLRTEHVSDINGMTHKPAEDILYPGDLIVSVNGRLAENKEVLQEEISSSEGAIELSIKREGELFESTITPIKCPQDNVSKIGAWVRDSTQGIGTVTYINPNTMKFGALGHGIMDVDTKKLMSVGNGSVWDADVKSIKKGKRGVPGELVGDIVLGKSLGEVRMNNAYGLYGVMNNDIEWLDESTVAVASKDEVTTGPAHILTNIGGDCVSKYDIVIESLNKNSCDNSKGIVIRIVDDGLLDKTNGIVQGMSGSPIIQNDKIIGAITHVFVQEPTKGYGIFIEHMLGQENGF